MRQLSVAFLKLWNQPKLESAKSGSRFFKLPVCIKTIRINLHNVASAPQFCPFSPPTTPHYSFTSLAQEKKTEGLLFNLWKLVSAWSTAAGVSCWKTKVKSLFKFFCDLPHSTNYSTLFWIIIARCIRLQFPLKIANFISPPVDGWGIFDKWDDILYITLGTSLGGFLQFF